jgi:hypothetical protein
MLKNISDFSILRYAHEHIIERWFVNGRAYKNPYMGFLISTLIGKRKLCRLVISIEHNYYKMLVHIWACFWESLYGFLISTLRGSRKLCKLQNVGSYMGVLIYWQLWTLVHIWACLWESLYGRVSLKHADRNTKLCSLVISMLMSILQNVGSYMGVLWESVSTDYAKKMLKLCSKNAQKLFEN